MRNIIIRDKILALIVSTLAISICFAKNVNNIDEIINEPQARPNSNSTPAPPTASKSLKKKIEVKKDKKGRFQVTWEIFLDYDSKKKSAGKSLTEIVGKDIILKGFMIPLDYSAKSIKEFLLVPYFPSCSHSPPPPESMIIAVSFNKKNGIKPSYYPVEVSGRLQYAKKKKGADQYMPTGVFSLKASDLKEIKN